MGNYFLTPGAILDSENVWLADQTFLDNIALTFGTGGDVDIEYNATDLIINPRVVGSGNVVFGKGEAGGSIATGVTLRAPNLASGSDIAGADITIAAGKGRGTGNVGTLIFQLPIVGTAGDNPQTIATRLTLDMVASTSVLTMSAAQALTISTPATDNLYLSPGTSGRVVVTQPNGVIVPVFLVQGTTGGGNAEASIQIDAAASDWTYLRYSVENTPIWDAGNNPTGNVYEIREGGSTPRFSIAFGGDMTFSPASGFFINTANEFSFASSTSNTPVNWTEASDSTARILLRFRKARGSIASPTAVQSGDNIGIFIAAPYDGAGYDDTAFIQFTATENQTASAHGTKIGFYTTPNAGTAVTLRWTVDQDGSLVAADGVSLQTGIVDDDFFTIGAVDNDDQTITELLRFQGAVDPYIQVTNGLYLTEQAAALADVTALGQFWVKNDTPNILMFTDDAGADQIIGGIPTFKSYSLANPGTADTFYIGGHYAFAAAESVLTIAGTVIQTFGSSGQAHGAHAFVVAKAAGGTDLVLTVTGISMTDAGVRNDSDSEVIVADTDQATGNQYFETTKKWLGQISFTLTGSAGAFTFNYGLVKYEDFGNRNFTITDFEATGEMRANETGLNVELLHHAADKFLFSASSFVPNQTALVSLAGDYGSNNDVATGDNFAYKRAAMSQVVAGDNGEGIIIRVTTAVTNSINHASFHVGARITA